MADELRLNIGAGDVEVPGFTPVDRKNGQEAYPLENEDNSVDEIRASHVLEHFGFVEARAALTDWIRALKPGGRIRLAVPDFEFIVSEYHRQGTNSRLLFAYAMGGQIDANDYHRCLFDELSLRELMEQCGLERVSGWKSEVDDCAALPVSLNLEGYKPIERQPVDIPQIIGCMSTAKLAFTENLFCAMQVLRKRGIDIIKYTGVFWGQCLERVMLDVIGMGAEWILTLDFDTAFTGKDFEELCYLMASHPEADAIAPWQVKRECDDPLVWMTDGEGNKRSTVPFSEFDGDLTRVDTAHFGLTLLRVEALKRMKHPWFLAQPNTEGTWGEGRVDEDIYFWNKWKAAGNSLYMANHVSIGHLQQVATWPGRDFRPIHQYITDFQKNGKPRGAR